MVIFSNVLMRIALEGMQHLQVTNNKAANTFAVLPDSGQTASSVPRARHTGVNVPKENIRDAGKWTQQSVGALA